MASNYSQTYHKANWDSNSFSLCKELPILQDQISSIIISNNLDPFNTNKAANILTDIFLNIP